MEWNLKNNAINLDYQNGKYKISGDSKLNVNDDTDSLSYSIDKKKDKIFLKTDFEVKITFNFELLNYTNVKSFYCRRSLIIIINSIK